LWRTQSEWYTQAPRRAENAPKLKSHERAARHRTNSEGRERHTQAPSVRKENAPKSHERAARHRTNSPKTNGTHGHQRNAPKRVANGPAWHRTNTKGREWPAQAPKVQRESAPSKD
jgi:hypothetical protein